MNTIYQNNYGCSVLLQESCVATYGGESIRYYINYGVAFVMAYTYTIVKDAIDTFNTLTTLPVNEAFYHLNTK